MTAMEIKTNRLQKFNIIFAILLMLALFLFVNSNILFAQEYREVGLNDPSIAGYLSQPVKIYQGSDGMLKFEINESSHVKIGIYDKNDNLVRTYIYNNLAEGTYEINFKSNNLDKGTYRCVLIAGGSQESSKITID